MRYLPYFCLIVCMPLFAAARPPTSSKPASAAKASAGDNKAAQAESAAKASPSDESTTVRLASFSSQESTAEEDTGARFLDFRVNEQLTGDWGGLRTSMADNGIELTLSMTHVLQNNARGGMQTHRAHRFTGSADYELTVDTAAAGLWEDGSFYILAESDWNDGIGGDRVGNYFGVNGDAGGDISGVVDEAWYEHSLWDGKARFRIGKMDVGVDFDTNAYANDETAQFLNPALINTGNVPMPDFGLGAQMIFEPVDWFYLGIVAADAQADGRETGFATAFHDEDHFFAALEFGFLPELNSERGPLPGGYRFGLWYDPQPKDPFLGGSAKRDDMGFYASFDQMIYRENATDTTDEQGLGMFFRYGYAHAETNEVESFWSIGAQYLGLIPSRDDDVLGFGFAQGILSHDLRRLAGGDRESVYELYYSIPVHPWLVITPDLQYIVNPGADDSTRDAFVAGVRVQMSF